MASSIVLIGSGDTLPCEELARALRLRGHRVTYLRQAGGDTQPADHRSGATSCCRADPWSGDVDWLFRNHTGTLRQADMIVVSSEVPHRAVVMRWVLDQGGGTVVYLDTDGSGDAALAGGTRFLSHDVFLSCSQGREARHQAGQWAAELEHYLSSLAVPASEGPTP